MILESKFPIRLLDFVHGCGWRQAQNFIRRLATASSHSHNHASIAATSSFLLMPPVAVAARIMEHAGGNESTPVANFATGYGTSSLILVLVSEA